MKLVIAIFLAVVSGSTFAQVPKEILGVWTPDIEQTIALMEKNTPDVDSAFMRENYLPKIKRTITENVYIHASGKREIKATISLKEKQGSTFVMVLSNDNIPGMEVTFIPKENGRYVMQSDNPADGSGNIVWKK